MPEIEIEIEEAPKPKVGKRVPAFANTPDKRLKLGQLLLNRIQSGLNAKDGLEQVWDKIQRFYENQRPSQATAPSRDLVAIHRPLLQPRIEGLVTNVTSVVAPQKPVMLCESDLDDDVSSRLENVVHRMWQGAGFDAAVRRAATIAGLTNRAIWRVWFDIQFEDLLDEGTEDITDLFDGPITYAGVRLDVIHPRDFVMSPATVEGIASAALVGHRFYRSVEHIKERQQLDAYFDDGPILGGDDANEYKPTASQYISSISVGEPDYELVELWEVIFRYKPAEGKRQRWFIATVVHNSGQILSVSEYNYSRPWYFEAGFIVEEDSFWSKKSVGANLYPLQEEYNNNCSLFYNGTQVSAFPPMFGPQVEDEKFSSYTMGQYIQIEGDPKIFTPAIKFDGQYLRADNADIERIADLEARVSNNNLGAEEGKEISATQTQAIQSGASAGITEYIREFSNNLPDMAAFTCELLASHYATWKPLYPTIKAERKDLKAAVAWEPNGKTLADSPMSRMIAFNQLNQFAHNLPQVYPLIDQLALMRLYLATCGITGAEKLLKEPVAPDVNQTLPPPPQAGGSPLPPNGGMERPNGLPNHPQAGANGEPLTPQPASTVRPAFDWTSTGGSKVDQGPHLSNFHAA